MFNDNITKVTMLLTLEFPSARSKFAQTRISHGLRFILFLYNVFGVIYMKKALDMDLTFVASYTGSLKIITYPKLYIFFLSYE